MISPLMVALTTSPSASGRGRLPWATYVKSPILKVCRVVRGVGIRLRSDRQACGSVGRVAHGVVGGHGVNIARPMLAVQPHAAFGQWTTRVQDALWRQVMRRVLRCYCGVGHAGTIDRAPADSLYERSPSPFDRRPNCPSGSRTSRRSTRRIPFVSHTLVRVMSTRLSSPLLPSM